MKVRGYAWAGVGTDDFERTVRFFTDVLGMPTKVRGEDVAILTVGAGQQLQIFGPGHPGRQLNSTPTIAFEVEDFDAAVEELRASGVELVGDVGEWNGFKWQYFRSPDGHLFEIKQVPVSKVADSKQP